MEIDLPEGIATGVGGLPHWDSASAVELSLRAAPELPFVPQLPRRSRYEGPVAQVTDGLAGVSIGRCGELVVDPASFDPQAPVTLGLIGEAWATWAAFATAIEGRTQPVKWQLCGPVTLADALVQAGVPADAAIDAAVASLRERVRVLHGVLATTAPLAPQVVVLDEPALARLHHDACAMAPDVAIDAVSGVLATLEALGAVTGVHCPGPADWPLVLGAGPGILSVPLGVGLEEHGGAVAAHLDAGGWVAWGAVPTDGPLGATTDRLWRVLGDAWCGLVRQGCDPALLRQRALITPAGGLAGHGRPQAEHVLRLATRLADRVRGQALAARFCLGA